MLISFFIVIHMDEHEFILALKKAKRYGVNVAKIFVECEEALLLMRVRVLGLVCSILWVFFCPAAIVALKLYVAIHKLDDIEIPEDLAYWTCALGFVSILAFGYDLIDLQKLLPNWFRAKDQKQLPMAIEIVEIPASDDVEESANGDV